MSDSPSFADLMTRLRAGDPGAAEEIFRRFANRLVSLARQRLDALVLRKLDPEDVLQSALNSFFRAHAQGRVDVRDWDSLWGLLAVITLRKCGPNAPRPRRSSGPGAAALEAAPREALASQG